MSVIKETYTRFELMIFKFYLILSYTLFCKQSLSLAYTEQIQCIAFYIPLTVHVMHIFNEN